MGQVKIALLDFRGLRWNVIVVEGTGLKRAPYRGRKIAQRPAPDLANWGAASVSLWKSPCNCSSNWRLGGSLQLYWLSIPEATAQNVCLGPAMGLDVA